MPVCTLDEGRDLPLISSKATSDPKTFSVTIRVQFHSNGRIFSYPSFRSPAEAGETKVQQFRPQRNMLSSLFSKIFADEQPADNTEAAKAEEATQEKTEGTPAEAVEEEAEEPEDVSYHRQTASENC